MRISNDLEQLSVVSSAWVCKEKEPEQAMGAHFLDVSHQGQSGWRETNYYCTISCVVKLLAGTIIHCTLLLVRGNKYNYAGPKCWE